MAVITGTSPNIPLCRESMCVCLCVCHGRASHNECYIRLAVQRLSALPRSVVTAPRPADILTIRPLHAMLQVVVTLMLGPEVVSLLLLVPDGWPADQASPLHAGISGMVLRVEKVEEPCRVLSLLTCTWTSLWHYTVAATNIPCFPNTYLPHNGLGGGLEFLPGHLFLFHKWDGKLYFFHISIGCISTMPCGHLCISPFSPKKIWIPKNSTPPVF